MEIALIVAFGIVLFSASLNLVHGNDNKSTAQSLSNLLTDNQDVQDFCINVAKSYTSSSWRRIMSYVLDEAYYIQPADVLAHQLYDIYLEDKSVDTNIKLNSLKMMIEAQLELFWKFQNLRDVNDDYVFTAAQLFKKIMANQQFSNVNLAIQRRLAVAKQSLPSAIDVLLEGRRFCMRNKQNKEYLYIPRRDEYDYGTNNRFAYTWYTGKQAGSQGFVAAAMKETSAQNSDFPKMKQRVFALRSEYFNWYYFMDTEKGNVLSASKSNSPRNTSYWTVNLIGDAIAFNQNGFTLCTGDSIDGSRRSAIAIRGQSAVNDNCQWEAFECQPVSIWDTI